MTDEKGRLRVDILRFENLNDDTKRYFSVDQDLRKRNVTSVKKKPLYYKDFYTPEMIQAVADWYQADIDFFGFDFDTSAQKNTIFSI